MKKIHILFLVSVILLVLGGVVWYGERAREPQENNGSPVSSNQSQDRQQSPQETQFVTDVDPDVNHWQTKETEFFTIKFPKEWYWMESDPKKTEYHSEVITNNPNFPIDKYPDIGVFTGYSLQLYLEGKKDQPLPLSSSEVVITTNNLGSVTSNSGTPREFMEGEIDRLKKDLYPEIQCHYTSDLNTIPLTAFCSFTDSNGQVVATYYSSGVKRTLAYTARFFRGNPVAKNIESTLEKITKSMVQKIDF